MKISFNWLKKYVNTDLGPDEISKILTDTGLEVEGVEKIETIPGGLAGLVVGEVVEKTKHPDADKLNLSKVNIGTGDLLNIVCGAPNLDQGQKVIVATIGTTLHPLEGDSFKIKKGKIRGQVSEGMLCAEDEIGLGKGHDGIIVLDENTAVGTPAREVFGVEDDFTIEIGLTPNRTDGMSHIGVARDLVAALRNMEGITQQASAKLTQPDVSDFAQDHNNMDIAVKVETQGEVVACPRYAGVCMDNIKIGPSPEWLQNSLRAIGLNPINNVVDITNFVLHETGQPLHAFDAAKINGDKIVVKTLPAGTKFTTLDETERTLHEDDLMICNAENGMCMAGVFGGIDTGVSESTTSIFLESAYFDPVFVRKAARRHGLNTDSSYRFERGVDPENTLFALKRAVLLIKEIAGGKIASALTDIVSKKIEPAQVKFSVARCNKLIGKELPKATILKILSDLDIKTSQDNGDEMVLEIPTYRADVTREADVIEEVLRIHGFNNVDFPEKLNASLSFTKGINPEAEQDQAADFLASKGFIEIMNNSLTQSAYAELVEEANIKSDFGVAILNPLSSDLNAMRQSLFFGAMEVIRRNQNHKTTDVRLFEFGNVYHKFENGYAEHKRLAVVLAGNKRKESWNNEVEPFSFYDLKGEVEQLLNRLGIMKGARQNGISNKIIADGLSISIQKKTVVEFGWVGSAMLKHFDIKRPVLFADFNWSAILELLPMRKVLASETSKFPAVRRDLSLMLDNDKTFAQIEELAMKTDRKILQGVSLFDVFEGDKLPKGKKSYAVSFILQDKNKTLNDKQIEKLMGRIQQSLESELGAQLR